MEGWNLTSGCLQWKAEVAPWMSGKRGQLSKSKEIMGILGRCRASSHLPKWDFEAILFRFQGLEKSQMT